MDANGLRRFSQFGEDGVISWCFNGKRDGLYVDIGCHDPYRLSNTAVLHLDFGWTGVNVDMDERAIEKFRLERPNDVNLCVGVASAPGRIEASFFEEGAVNSLDAATAAAPQWAPFLREKKLIDVVPLSDIFVSYAADRKVDFLNVDAEGLDHQILASNDWSAHRPSCVAVESHDLRLGHAEQNETYRFMIDRGYMLLSHVVATSIYVIWSDIEVNHRRA